MRRVASQLASVGYLVGAAGITFPKGGLMWALAHEHGVDLGDDWLAKNPPSAKWKGESPSSERILTLSINRY